MALDPTRPVMVDGGNCLVDESLPVNGVHYQESFWRDYPDEAYTLAKAYIAHEKPAISWGKVLWRLVPDRPIFLGESFYVSGSNPAAFSQFGGEGCFTGWGPGTQQGVGLLAKMLCEGYRWHGVAAYHLSDVGSGQDTLHYNSWKPVCVLCRQWNWTFGGGSTVARTLKVFNDTHYSDPIEMAWELRLEDKPVAGQKRTFQLGPGQHEEVQISCAVPPVSKRTAGQFILTCSRERQGGLPRGEDRGGPQSQRGAEAVAGGRATGRASIRRGRSRPGCAAAASPSRRPRASPTCRPSAAWSWWARTPCRPATPPIRDGWPWPPAAPGSWCWSRSIRCTSRPCPPTLCPPTTWAAWPSWRTPSTRSSPAWRRPISSPGRATTWSTATSTRRPRAAPSRWPIATSNWAARPSPNARSTRA